MTTIFVAKFLRRKSLGLESLEAIKLQEFKIITNADDIHEHQNKTCQDHLFEEEVEEDKWLRCHVYCVHVKLLDL